MEKRDAFLIATAAMSAAAFIMVEHPSVRMIAMILLAGLLAVFAAFYLEAKMR